MTWTRYVGIDYSGAATADTRLPGLRVWSADADGDREMRPESNAKRHWTRRNLWEFLDRTLSEPEPTIIGIDHGLSFPEAWFARHRASTEWSAFLEEISDAWPTDAPEVRVDDVRVGAVGSGASLVGDTRWRRRCEVACPGTKSVFHFDVQGSVAKSTHAGLPWIRRLRRAHRNLHIWPFDGIDPPRSASVLCEAFPTLFRDDYPAPTLTPDQRDARAVALWLRDMDARGRLQERFRNGFEGVPMSTLKVEGWIIGLGAPQATVSEAPR